MSKRLPIRRIEEVVRGRKAAPPGPVTNILDRVKRDGDAAVAEFARAFGDPAPRRVSSAECARAFERIPAGLRTALERMSARVATFARAQRNALTDFSYESDGLVMGQRVIPIRSIGAYVPSGRHPLPSTAIMTVVPAKVAGVERVALCTPHAVDAILAACALLGVDEVYEMGGAQAVGAFAFGTQTIAAVDKIVGPGNEYVSEAKRQVAGVCGIDLPAGPSEVAVIASRDADPATVARSLLAEAEHDTNARAYLLVDDARFADRVEVEIERQAAQLPSAPVALAALAASAAIVGESLEDCVRIADVLAIEHLELHGAEAARQRDRVSVYGALFVELPAAFGDYGAGPNHTLPTGGAARFASGLSVYDFLAVRPFTAKRKTIDARLREDCETLAETESLWAHRAALAAAR